MLKKSFLLQFVSGLPIIFHILTGLLCQQRKLPTLYMELLCTWSDIHYENKLSKIKSIKTHRKGALNDDFLIYMNNNTSEIEIQKPVEEV